MQAAKDDTIISGLINTSKGNITFYGDNFKFVFMNSNPTVEVSIDTDANGYIWGKTYDNRIIAIYAKQCIKVKSSKALNTWNYIISRYMNVSKESISSLRGIRFVNGTIRTISPCDALHEDFSTIGDGKITYTVKDDSIKYEVDINNEKLCWKFGSEISQKMSLEEGNSLSNGNAILDVVFEIEKDYKAFYDWYGYVCDFCSFMSFRNNISFERIYLLRDTQYEMYDSFAECYVKKDGDVSQKKYLNNIPVSYLSKDVFCEMLKNIIKIDEEHKGLPIFITPKDDRDANLITIDKIRNICSALEMELDFCGISKCNDTKIQNLKNSVKELIKNHRKGTDKLTEKEYSYIFNSISHWGQPLSERAYCAWCLHEGHLKKMIEMYDLSITKEKIEAFVKTRNKITHDGFTGIDENVADTAFAIIGLIYCCTLTRLKMKSDEIDSIIKRDIFQ